MLLASFFKCNLRITGLDDFVRVLRNDLLEAGEVYAVFRQNNVSPNLVEGLPQAVEELLHDVDHLRGLISLLEAP